MQNRAAVSLLLLVACAAAPAPDEAVAPVESPVATPALPTAKAGHPAYGMFLLKIRALHDQMAERLDKADYQGLVFPAQQIGRHGTMIASMCTDLPPDSRKDVEAQVKILTDLSRQLEVAVATGEIRRISELVEGYEAPLSALRKYQP